ADLGSDRPHFLLDAPDCHSHRHSLHRVWRRRTESDPRGAPEISGRGQSEDGAAARDHRPVADVHRARDHHSRDRLRKPELEALAPGDTGVARVPPLTLALAQLPAEKHGLPLTLMKKIDQADGGIAQHDAPLLQLTQIMLERLRQLAQMPGRQASTIL